MAQINPKLLQQLQLKNIDVKNILNYENKLTGRNPQTIDTPDRTLLKSSTSGQLGSGYRIRSNQAKEADKPISNIVHENPAKSVLVRPSSASKQAFKTKMISTHTPKYTEIPIGSQTTKAIVSQKLLNTDFMSKDERFKINNELDLKKNKLENIEIFNLNTLKKTEFEGSLVSLNKPEFCKTFNLEENALPNIVKIELKVDLSLDSLQEIGEVLVNLKQLKLNNSFVSSLRDIGNSFRNLTILWVSNCNLSDLGGLSAFPMLTELYASYNDVADLSNLSFHERLQVLDLEGNNIQNMETINNVCNLGALKCLNLAENPICKIKNYESEVFKILPYLDLLNDKSKEEVQSRATETESKPIQHGDDNEQEISELYKRFQKISSSVVDSLENNTNHAALNYIDNEPSEEDLILMSTKRNSKKAKALYSGNDKLGQPAIDGKIDNLSYNTPLDTLFNKKYNKSERSELMGGSSDLVHQANEAFAGNPLKALRHKRKTQFTTGIQNIEGQDIAKPKDILQLIEEFQIDTEDSSSLKELNKVWSRSDSTLSNSDKENINKNDDNSEFNHNTESKVNENIFFKRKTLKAEDLSKNETLSGQVLQNDSLINLKQNLINNSELKDKGNKTRIKIQIKTRKAPPISGLSNQVVNEAAI